jgi:hypothetical protein
LRQAFSASGIEVGFAIAKIDYHVANESQQLFY